MEADGADGAGSEDKVSEAVKAVRTCQNSLGRNSTCLGLLLLLVGPDGDEFGGQAFMEHYTVLRCFFGCQPAPEAVSALPKYRNLLPTSFTSIYWVVLASWLAQKSGRRIDINFCHI
jgi:hypothetical protein